MLGKPQIKNFKVADNFAISVIREADSLIEEIDNFLKESGVEEEISNDSEYIKKIEAREQFDYYSKLVKASDDGFGGKYIFND